VEKCPCSLPELDVGLAVRILMLLLSLLLLHRCEFDMENQTPQLAAFISSFLNGN
jgi:hypothetical protein